LTKIGEGDRLRSKFTKIQKLKEEELKENLMRQLERTLDKLCRLVFGDTLKIFHSNKPTRELLRNGGVEFMGYCTPALMKKYKQTLNLRSRWIPDEAVLINRYPVIGFLRWARNRRNLDTSMIAMIAHELRHRFQQQNHQLKLYSLKDLLKWMANKEGKEDWERVFEPLVDLCYTSHLEQSKNEKDAFCVSVMASYTWEETKDLKAVAQIIKSESKK